MRRSRRIVLGVAVSLFATSFMASCAHMEKSPPERQTGYLLIHKPLPEASRAIDAARAAGKDRECPAEFKAAKDTVDQAYAIYIACRTQEAIAMAQDGINKANALCPPKVAEVQEEPSATGGPVPPPAPVPAPAPVPPPAAAPQPKTMAFEEAALFDFDKANLKPKGKEQLKAYSEQAQADMSGVDKIVITGHTDSIGTEAYNMKLSQRRAEAVRDYLTKLGVDPNKMEVRAAGESKPIADNATKAGRAKNRRVEVDFVGTGK